MNDILARFLDGEGRLKQLPQKRAYRALACDYLADKFEYDRDYTETEVNGILSRWHTFEDYFILRRELVEGCWLCRLPNGSRYWRNRDKTPQNTQAH